MPWRGYADAIQQKKALALKAQPTALRRCLSCERWMRSTGADHRICNGRKGDVAHARTGPGSLIRMTRA